MMIARPRSVFLPCSDTLDHHVRHSSPRDLAWKPSGVKVMSGPRLPFLTWRKVRESRLMPIGQLVRGRRNGAETRMLCGR
jgi:hypothetical protein